MGKGGGGQQAPSQQTVTNTSIPAYARAYVERMLGKSEALADTPYQTYGGERTAGFNNLQNQAFGEAQNLGPAQQIGTATQLAGMAGLGSLQAGANFNPQAFANQYNAPSAYQTGQFGVNGVTAAPIFDNQYNAPSAYQTGQFGVNDVTADKLRQYQMGAAERVSGPESFSSETVKEYMNPYMQNVVDVQKREAQRQADIAASQRAGQAAQVGAFGGSRMGLENAMANRENQRLMSDIQATGSSAAYQAAQQQFNTQQQGKMQAALANQAAGMNVGQQNLAALLGVQQLGSQQSMQAQLANQAAAQQARQMQEASRQYGYGQNMNAAQLRAQYGTAAQQFGAQQSMQAQLANQAAAQQAQQLEEASRQYGYGQNMNAAQLAAQYGLSAQQATEQSRQFGANLGLQGYGQGLQAANTLGQLGQTQFGQQQAGMQARAQAGAQQQNLEQQKLLQQYQDFLDQRGYNQKQQAFMSDILRGVPMSQSTQSMFQAQASPFAIAGGLGATYLGAQKAGLFAKGGLTGLALHNMAKGK
jgi:hypothetical protein